MSFSWRRPTTTHPGISAISALEATRRPAGHRSVISVCFSLSRYAPAANPVATSPSAADVSGGMSGNSESSQVRPDPFGDPLAGVHDVFDGHDDGIGPDGREGEGWEVPLGNSHESPIKPDRGERPPFCSRAASFFFLVSEFSSYMRSRIGRRDIGVEVIYSGVFFSFTAQRFPD